MSLVIPDEIRVLYKMYCKTQNKGMMRKRIIRFIVLDVLAHSLGIDSLDFLESNIKRSKNQFVRQWRGSRGKERNEEE